MASATEIGNLALTLLGETRLLASLDDELTSARLLKAAFDIERDSELRQHVWNFAKKRAVLSPLLTPPPFGFTYAYSLPADWLRFLRIDEDWQHSIEDGKLLTDAGPELRIHYVARVAETGRWDALFVRALAARLAMATCLGITGSIERGDRAAAEYRRTIADARQIDAVENLPDDRPDDDWIMAREMD